MRASLLRLNVLRRAYNTTQSRAIPIAAARPRRLGTLFAGSAAVTLAILALPSAFSDSRIALEGRRVRSAWVDPPPEEEEEEEKSQEEKEDEGHSAAFDPVTGEINWDCSCLGGMAHGPCGPQFREAFACFVYSNQEPKGVDCVEKFQHMQDCFRAHPDVYGEEIADDDEDSPVNAGEALPTVTSDSESTSPLPQDDSNSTPSPEPTTVEYTEIKEDVSFSKEES